MIDFKKIPQALRDRDQWCLWKFANDTKLPFQRNGKMAASDNPKTWCDFAGAVAEYERSGFAGIGYFFAADDPFCGVDLDGCRNPETGEVSLWARDIIARFDTYAEVSPSQTGIKLFVIGRNPMESGKKKKVPLVAKVSGKEPQIEVYDRLRYFAVTGTRVKGPHEPQARQDKLDWLQRIYWRDTLPDFNQWSSEAGVIERAKLYLSRIDGAVSGSGGHNHTFYAACRMVLGFGLSPDVALSLLREWNQTCSPPWSDKELIHKVNQAAKQPGERNYLRNESPERWEQIEAPVHESPKPELKVTTIAEAARQYINALEAGATTLIELGLGDVDYAIGGGVQRGEVIVIAARPSHGKSAIALQCIHAWTANERPSLIVSEEMSALLLGKRTLQFVSDVPEDAWLQSIEQLREQIEYYEEKHERCLVVESCGTVDAVVEQIDKATSENQIQAAVVDYVQLLDAPGKTRYDKVTNASRILREAAKRNNIVLVLLAQLSRAIEGRNKFIPIMSDLKESGQLEQDADVILFLVWPHKIDDRQPKNVYQVYVGKNRNRITHQAMVESRFIPARQMLTAPKPNTFSATRREGSFDAWNDS